ncbi:MAG: hypothetical protein A2806_00710 [Candidatus Terrybacteria bacterium RIFCSPHIGHO2_01_FULL_48_17]|uniref:Uncharacterized protein n=1 Tax=Candidatus Terrybacteria bacterium RIFCSPHIGHO2_01_FULL_48_17 TaxID=1802362 RepID=A0A1G2PII8_9BACT|nr:MAG: hypothetical protein A2806_00710 [Candidatus Terrybacteria bacterium RIFCSPHIGHO2_01_FULL_48_17]OHA53860.1 MAG: hypothetical protein A3A30_01310 [Candidatus Terrybacteria bacterium RIFCSPLOWO2_01_FULL_48_14]
MFSRSVSSCLQGFRAFLGIHPRAQANDVGSVAFLGMIVLSVLVAYFITVASTGNAFVAVFVLPTCAAAYVLSDIVYSTWQSVFHRHRVRIEAESKTNDGYQKAGIWRLGEYVGAAVATLTLLIPALVAYRITAPLPFGWDDITFKLNPKEMFVVLDVTVGILAASSIAKLVSVPYRPRVAHNNVLLFLCVVSTITIMAVLVQDARGRAVFPEDLSWSYLIILASYASHNVMLSILCPNVRQKRPGHIVAFGVYLFFAALLVVFAGTNMLVRIPSALFAFYAITLLVMLISGVFRYLLEEPLVKVVFKRNEEDKNSAC